MKPINEFPVQRTLYLGFDPLPEFSDSVRKNIFGPQGSYLKHIQSQTGSRVQLRGKGSGFVDLTPAKGKERPPLHLFIAAPSEEEAGAAVKLAEDLISTAKANYEQQLASRDAYNAYAQYYAQYQAYYQQFQKQP